MKRIWVGIGLLAVLLAASIWTGERMEKNHLVSAARLQQAAALSAAGNWDEAEACAGLAWQNWQKKWHLTASVAHQEPMDEIDALFAQLQIFAAVRDQSGYSSTCAQLSSLLEAMGESHSFYWWNLL